MARSRKEKNRRLPSFDTLEGRVAPAYDLTMGIALGTAGSPASLTPYDIKVNDSAIDAGGNVYCVGTWRGRLVLTSAGAPTFMSLTTGFKDGFVAKYSPSGAFLAAAAWNGKTSGSSFQPRSVAIDASGNLIVGGSFGGNVNLDPQAPNNPATDYTTVGLTDPFLLKLDPSLKLVWGRAGTGSASATDEVDAVALDPSGNIGVTGQFAFPMTLGTSVLSTTGNTLGFVAKYDSSGTLLWANQSTGISPSQAGGLGVSFDPSGNLVVAGYFAGTVVLGSAGQFTLNAVGGRDILVAKYAGSDGTVTWARGIGGIDFDQAGAVATDTSGNVYLTGSYTGLVNFGTQSTPFNLTATGSYDAFIAKLDSTGQTIWAQGLSELANYVGQGNGLVVTPTGLVVASGLFTGTMTVAPGPFAIKLSSKVPTATDVFLVTLDSSGQPLSARQLGGSSSDASFGLSINGSGQLGVAGNFAPSASGIVVPSGNSYEVLSFAASFGFTSGPMPGTIILVGGTGPLANQVNTSSVTFTAGSVASGNTMLLYRSGTLVANRIGSGTISDPGPLADGTNSYTWRQVTSSGDFGALSSPIQVIIDRAPPAAPSTPKLLPADDTGTLGDNITSVARPRLVGTAEPNSTLQLLSVGSVLGSVTTDTSGNYVVQPTASLVDGVYTLTARAVDQAGNIGPSSNILTLTILSVVPGAPSTPLLVATDDSGTLGDGITNVQRPRFSGTAPANQTVQLVVTATSLVIGSTFADNTGKYTVQPTLALADGSYSLAARSINTAGNQSPLSNSSTIVILTAPPATPTSAPSLVLADDSGTIGDLITNVRQPHLSGNANSGLTVQFLDVPSSILLGTAQAMSGIFTIQPSTPFGEGLHTLAVKLIDVAGNFSGLSPSLLLTILSIPPAAPAPPTLLAADDSGVLGDNLTNVTAPRIVGTAKTSGILQLINTATNIVLGSTVVVANANYQVAPAVALTDGTYALAVRIVDVAANVGANSAILNLSILTATPATPSRPTLLPADDSGTLGDNITSVRRPRFFGTATAGLSVQLLSASTPIGSTVADGTGNYSLQPTNPLSDGNYTLTVQGFDVAGNVSALSQALLLTIQTGAPSAPSSPTILPADDSGTSGDGITNVRRPRLTGTTGPGLTVQLLNAAGNSVIGSTIADNAGIYTVQPTVAFVDGTYLLAARAVDRAGNISPPSSNVPLVISGTPPISPSTPPLLSPADDTGTLGDLITSVRRPRLTGTASNGLIAQLIDTSTLSVLGSLLVTSGSYSITPTGLLPVGPNILAIRLIDVAGNVSGLSPSITLTILFIPPVAPALPTLVVADDSGTVGDNITNVSAPRLTGIATSTGTIQLLNMTTNLVIGSTAVTGNSAYQVAPGSNLADGTYSLVVRILDVAGNVGAVSATFSLTILATAPLALARPALLAADDSGVPGDGITNVTTPRLTGMATSSGTVQLLNTATNLVVGSGTAIAGQSYQVSPATGLFSGLYSLTVRVVDLAGNIGVASPILTLTILTNPPGAPGPPILSAADDSGIKGDNITKVHVPRLTGTSTASGTLQLVDSRTGLVIGSTVAIPNTAFQVTPTSALADGIYSLVVRVVDIAANIGASGPILKLTILTALPPAPALPVLLAADDSGTQGDNVTRVVAPRLFGTAPSTGTLQLIDTATGSILGTSAVTVNSTYQIAPSVSFGDGTYSLAVQILDIADNLGPNSPVLSLRILTVSPPTLGVPQLLLADDSGFVGDNITKITTPHLTGVSLTAGIIQLVDARTGIVLGSTTGTANAIYQVVPAIAFTDGSYNLAVRLVDIAGNVGALSPSLTLVILSTAPATPGTPTLLATDDSGVLGDNLTNVTSPRLVGTATVPGTIQLIDTSKSIIIGTANVLSGSPFQVSSSATLTDATYTIAFRLVDVAGNTSLTGPSLALTILTAIPATPLAPVLLPADDTGIKGDSITVVRKPRLIGNALAGQTVDLLDAGGTLLASTTLGAGSSAYTLQWPNNSGVTTVNVRTRVTDVAGNVSAMSPVASIKIIAVPDDFDGDGKTDLSLFRPSTGQWLIQNSGGGSRIVSFGAPNLFDLPVAGDYDGDGKADLAIFRPSTGQWLIQNSGGGNRFVSFGAPNLFDLPIPADYDGDGKADLALFRPSIGQWLIQYSGGGSRIVSFGTPNLFDIPVPADYDGDGKTDLAIFRPSTGQWLIQNSAGGNRFVSFGAPNLFDIPVPGDYDGDGKADLAIFRPSTGQWLIQYSGGGSLVVSFGGPNLFDLPIPGPAINLRASGKLKASSPQSIGPRTASFVQTSIPTSVAAPMNTTSIAQPRQESARTRQWPNQLGSDRVSNSKIPRLVVARRTVVTLTWPISLPLPT